MKDYEFVPKRDFEEFSMMVDVWFRTVLKELEAERRARMALATEVESLQGDAPT